MARRFTNGTSDEIDFGRLSGALDGRSALTLAAWVRLRSSSVAWTHVVCMFDGGAGFALMHGEDGSGLYSEIPGYEAHKDSVFTVDTWTHVAVRYDTSLSGDARFELFLDGAKVTGTTRYGSMPANTGTSTARLRIGGTDHETDNRPNDDIAHVAIWRSGLSDADIAALAAGSHALLFSPYFYAPLYGGSPEPDLAGAESGSVTGTSVVDGPPVAPTLSAPNAIDIGTTVATPKVTLTF